MQEMSPLPIRVGDRVDIAYSLFLELTSGKGSPANISKESQKKYWLVSLIYIFSLNFRTGKGLPKIARYISAIIDRFLDGKRLDPDLADRFNRFLPEPLKNKMRGAKLLVRLLVNRSKQVLISYTTYERALKRRWLTLAEVTKTVSSNIFRMLPSLQMTEI